MSEERRVCETQRLQSLNLFTAFKRRQKHVYSPSQEEVEQVLQLLQPDLFSAAGRGCRFTRFLHQRLQETRSDWLPAARQPAERGAEL